MSEAESRTPRSPKLLIEVTADIIRDSKMRTSSHCMTAEAIRAAYPDASAVAVDIQTIRFSDLKKGLRFVYLTPRIVQKNIIAFDQEETPPPFSFRLQAGSVHVAGRRPDSRTGTEKQQAQRLAAAAAGLKKVRLVNRQGPATEAKGGGFHVPERVGGKPPPLNIGQRREFGLRGFDQIR